MSLRQNIVFKRLLVLGLKPSHIQPIINLVELWIKHNGFDWTISRLKQFKIGYIHNYADQKADLNWISHIHNVPKGPFKNIWKMKNPNKALNALMIYTDLVSPKVTIKQWTKFFKSAQQDNPISDIRILWPEAFPNSRRIYNSKNYEFAFPQSLQSFKFENLDRITLKSIRTPQWNSDTLRSGENSAYNMSRTFRHHLAVNYLYDNYDYRNGFPEWFQKGVMRQFKDVREMVYDHERIGDYVGRISFIQEPGFKLRAVANPVISLQILMEPLKNFVMNSLKVIPEDYCHDQDQAILDISRYLRHSTDNRLSSIDLSDATNNIPLGPQIQLLETLLGPKHPQIELFHQVSRGKWHVESPSGESSVTFNNGQPLGSGPSFGVFSLFHHFVARCAICEVEEDPKALVDFFSTLNNYDLESGSCRDKSCTDPDPYAYWIVGDDIVIDSKYSDEYLRIMNIYYQVPISVDKCLFDTRTAEFCSRLISSTAILHAFKWKTISDSSFLHIAKSLGPKSLPLFRPKQQRVLKAIGYIPDTIGGPVSWNPDGLPLGIREQLFWDDANKLANSVNDTAKSIRSSDLTYMFYRDLKVILSFGINPTDSVIPLFDGQSESSVVNHIDKGKLFASRQRDILKHKFHTYLYEKHDSVNKDVEYSKAFLLMVKDMPDILTRNLTSKERARDHTWLTHTYFDHISEMDVYFEKLYKLFVSN